MSREMWGCLMGVLILILAGSVWAIVVYAIVVIVRP